MTLNDIKINHGSLQSHWRRRRHDVIHAVRLLAQKLRVNVLLQQF